MFAFADPDYRRRVIESALAEARRRYRNGEIDATALYVDFVRSIGASREQIDAIFE
jgi:hypothetical protein